jgi:hypothetical protein
MPRAPQLDKHWRLAALMTAQLGQGFAQVTVPAAFLN